MLAKEVVELRREVRRRCAYGPHPNMQETVKLIHKENWQILHGSRRVELPCKLMSFSSVGRTAVLQQVMT